MALNSYSPCNCFVHCVQCDIYVLSSWNLPSGTSKISSLENGKSIDKIKILNLYDCMIGNCTTEYLECNTNLLLEIARIFPLMAVPDERGKKWSFMCIL